MFLSLGVRHTFGVFLQPVTQAHSWGREVFALAIALQNLVWGLMQPWVGRYADKHGATPVVLAGGLLLAFGVGGMALTTHPAAFVLFAGVFVGLGLSGTTFPVVYGAVSRVVPANQRDMAYAMAMALGSFGQFAFLPVSVGLLDRVGWIASLLLFAAALLMIVPLSRALLPCKPVAGGVQTSAMQALRQAFSVRDYHWLSVGYFVCGFHVVFIGVHLPAYLLDQGLPAQVGSTALAFIGLFNIAGSLMAGKLAGRFSRSHLLAGIYFSRSVAVLLFTQLPLSEFSVYVFAAAMGFLWLSTVPLTNGTVAAQFGLRNVGMLTGMVFLWHQVGAFLGGWLGGRIFDLLGGYEAMWWMCIALGLVAAAFCWPVRQRLLVPA
jgi:MFS family permease